MGNNRKIIKNMKNCITISTILEAFDKQSKGILLDGIDESVFIFIKQLIIRYLKQYSEAVKLEIDATVPNNAYSAGWNTAVDEQRRKDKKFWEEKYMNQNTTIITKQGFVGVFGNEKVELNNELEIVSMISMLQKTTSEECKHQFWKDRNPNVCPNCGKNEKEIFDDLIRDIGTEAYKEGYRQGAIDEFNKRK